MNKETASIEIVNELTIVIYLLDLESSLETMAAIFGGYLDIGPDSLLLVRSKMIREASWHLCDGIIPLN